MSRQRKPSALHAIEGTLNPTRHADRGREPQGRGTLGAPPRSWSASDRAIWYELKKLIPQGVASRNDRAMFELLCRLFSKIRESPDNLSPALVAQVRCLLNAFGLSPASRAQLSVPPAPKRGDLAGEYFLPHRK